jgi:hypothetical protein
MFVENKKILKAKCRACGHITTLDVNHKVAAFLLKADLGTMSEIVGADPGATKKPKKPEEDKKEKEPDDGGLLEDQELTIHSEELGTYLYYLGFK